jgi:hypothetical protein
MRIWPTRNRPDEDVRADADRAAREHIARTAAAEAARQRRERDQAVPPEHRADEVECRETAARWNQPTRRLTPARLRSANGGRWSW